MKNKTKKCPVCQEKYPEDEFYQIANRGDYEGQAICEFCYSYNLQEPETVLTYYTNGEKYKFHIGADVVECIGEGYFDPSEWPAVADYLNRFGYCSTDAWRGFYEGQAPKQFENVISSWFGTIDGANITGDLKLFHERLEVDKKKPDFDMIVSFPRTSNVCASGIEVYVRSDDKKQFEEWLHNVS